MLCPSKEYVPPDNQADFYVQIHFNPTIPSFLLSHFPRRVMQSTAQLLQILIMEGPWLLLCMKLTKH